MKQQQPAIDSVVFVIDDDASVRRALARQLSTRGFLVETFDSAQSFLTRRSAPRPRSDP